MLTHSCTYEVNYTEGEIANFQFKLNYYNNDFQKASLITTSKVKITFKK